MLRLACLIIAVSITSQAQLVVTHSQEAKTAASRVRLITLEMRNAPVKQVLDAIARQVGARTLYSANVVNLSTRVSVNLRNASVEQALASAIAGTTLQAKVAPDGETIVIGRQTPPKSQESGQG